MSRPQFSEALVARRHELGLSVRQASKILRLREDVLIAFEEGDYEHMPQSGYAQGMLSSYARYLGLNAREIVDLFQEDLYQYRHGTSSHELRRRTRDTQAGRGIAGYDLPNEAGSRPKAYVEYRPLLPTSGGPAGDMGAFATTAPARPRTSVPLVGTGSSAAGTRSSYASSLSYDHAGSTRPYNMEPAGDRGSSGGSRRRNQNTRRRKYDDNASRLLSERQRSSGYDDDFRGQMPTGRLYRRDDVSMRRVRPSEYTDDLRYDDRPSPYAPASTLSGRRSSRNIASVVRPNVRRRQPRSGGGRRPQRREGLFGPVFEFLSDPRRALFSLILVLAVALTAILLFSVNSCVSARTQPNPSGNVVPVGTTDQQTSEDDEAPSTADDDEQADEPATSNPETTDEQPQKEEGADETTGDAAQGAQDQQPKETIVDVTVAAGEVSWVEITNDGVSKVAQSVTGPWTGSYNVHDAITIQVDNPEAVSVTENNQNVSFSSHAGGLDSLTIEGTPLPEPAEGESDQADAASGDEAASTDQEAPAE